MRSLVDIKIGDNILTADLAAAQRRLQAHPWVRSANVERQYPNVHIAFQERLPYAVAITLEQGPMWCDEEGYVLYPFSQDEQEQDVTTLVIEGLGTMTDTVNGPRIGSDHQWHLARLMMRSFQDGMPELTSLQFDSAWVDATTSLGQNVRLPLTGAESALRRMMSIWLDLENRVSFTTLDLRFEGEFVYEGAPSQ